MAKAIRQIQKISLGIIDLVYPAHWQPYIAQHISVNKPILISISTAT
ncbi:IgaA/UmoB family intracellular growth attenuator [Escherichia coli]